MGLVGYFAGVKAACHIGAIAIVTRRFELNAT